MDKVLFISDIHGYDNKLYNELCAIANGNEVPKNVIFLGDVAGTELLDKLQQLFYNQVYNHIRSLLKVNSYPTDNEILSYQIGNEGTLAEGCQKLWSFLHQLMPMKKNAM